MMNRVFDLDTQKNCIISDKPLDKHYRLCVAVFIISEEGDLWLGKRVGLKNFKTAWQVPQGGIEKNETTENALARELYEETGVKKAKIIRKSKYWYSYNLPPKMKIKGYQGQTQKWFLAQVPRNTEFHLTAQNQEYKAEFVDWKWIEKNEIKKYQWLEYIVEFKQELYRAVLREFGII